MLITNLHEDIIQTHILTRLDGRSLAATGGTSSHLQSLCSSEKLWSHICSSSWPSTQHGLVSQAILNFKFGHRSLFYDAFPSLTDRLITATTPPPTSQLISCVDLWYRDQIVVSKVESTDTTATDWFLTCPFRIDVLEPKELVQSALEISGDDDQLMQSDLEKHMTLSWILIDPTQNRAMNLSSIKPVSIHRNWLTDEIELTFSVVTVVDSSQDDYDHVNFNIEVTCGVKEGSLELYVSGVCLTVQDIDGKCMNGKDSMVILQRLMVAERRWRNDGGRWQKEKYNEYIRQRNERKEIMERRERRLDLVRVGCVVALLMVFWSFALL